MKKSNIITALAFIAAPALVFTACNNNDAKYKNLETGEKVYIVKSETGEAMDSVSGKPVEFYVDLNTKDTIYGRTGVVVNNKIVKNADGVYVMSEPEVKSEVEELIESGEDVKIKVDGDKMKIKTDDKKIKIDGDDKKVKYDN